jgi:co-chaperonin GroES (HSP10)
MKAAPDKPDRPETKSGVQSASSNDALPVDSRVTRHVMPLGPRILARILPSENRTATGLFLPEGAKDSVAEAAYAVVVEVARAAADEQEGFGTNVSGIPDGARVLFGKNKGIPVPWDDKLRIVDVKDVLAIVEEIGLDAAH